MPGNVARPFRFFLERWIQKGILSQLLLMAGLVAFVAVAGGLAAWIATPRFETAPEAIWWGFLRLTDPGYLGDDEGAVLRTISTVITVLGYVIFMGSLIAIMTQWLAHTMRKLESGVTPIAMRDHVVILGWTNRTPEVVLKLLGARGRLQRFLVGLHARKLRVVVLSDDAGAERRLELREHLGEHWSESQVFLRSGSSLHLEHLMRLDLSRASVVVVPGADFELGGSEVSDTRVIKTLMTVGSLVRSLPVDQRPHVVAEIFDPHKVPIARTTLEAKLEVVASNRIISRLISQSVRHRGMAQILFGIFSHRQGNSLYLRGFPELAGHTPRALAGAFREAVVLGFLRREDGADRVVMDPDTREAVGAEDLLILLADSYDHCTPSRPPGTAEPEPARPQAAGSPAQSHRILVLGWSHKIGALITELDESGSGRFELTVVSRTELADREYWLRRIDYDAGRIGVHNVLGDYSIEADLVAVGPGDFDHIVLLASDWMDSSEAADARTVLGYALLTSLFADAAAPPEILVELLDPNNASLFEERTDVILVTPRVLSHLLAHVALRPELNSVFEELFGAGGSEIDLHPASDFGLVGRSATFADVQAAAFERGLVALGINCVGGPTPGVSLNPDRSRSWTLDAADRIVVLATETPGA